MTDKRYPCRLSCGTDADPRSQTRLCAECSLKVGVCLDCRTTVPPGHACPNARIYTLAERGPCGDCGKKGAPKAPSGLIGDYLCAGCVKAQRATDELERQHEPRVEYGRAALLRARDDY